MAKPTPKPRMIDPIRKNLFVLALQTITIANTSPDSAQFCKLPNVPLCFAPAPPAMYVMPTLIKVNPIKVTAVPVTNGVKIFCVRCRKRLAMIGMNEPKKQSPKIIDNASCGDIPCLREDVATASIGDTKAKLVP